MVSNKEQIIELFYTKHLKTVDIDLKLDISNAYVSKKWKRILGTVMKKYKGNN